MAKILELLRDSVRRPSPVAPQHLYAYKTRFALLGTVGSGKSTFATLLILASQTRTSDDPHFKCLVLESTSGILSDASRMRRGRFPTKSKPYLSYATEAGLLMRWEGLLGTKNVQVPICDLAGEDIQTLCTRYRQGQLSPIGHANYNAAMQLISYVKEADGFIVTVPASKAMIYKDGAQLEKESPDVDVDPDVNLARILGEVYHHKKQVTHRGIKGIAVIVTKWDLIRHDAENMGINIYTPQGMKSFMDIYFPSTSQVLGWYGLDHVRFFPSYVDLQYDENGEVKRWEDNSPKIKPAGFDAIGKPTRKPSCDEQSCMDMIAWLKTFAT